MANSRSGQVVDLAECTFSFLSLFSNVSCCSIYGFEGPGFPFQFLVPVTSFWSRRLNSCISETECCLGVPGTVQHEVVYRSLCQTSN